MFLEKTHRDFQYFETCNISVNLSIMTIFRFYNENYTTQVIWICSIFKNHQSTLLLHVFIFAAERFVHTSLLISMILARTCQFFVRILAISALVDYNLLHVQHNINTLLFALKNHKELHFHCMSSFTRWSVFFIRPCPKRINFWWFPPQIAARAR